MLPFTYVLYQDIYLFYQHHRLQSSVWTAHQHVMGHISMGHEPKSSRSDRDTIKIVLTDLRRLMFVLVVYNLCGASALQSVKLQISLGDAAVQDITLGSKIRFVQTVCNHTFKVIKLH